MIRWGHGHSTALGVILGVAVFGGHLIWGLTIVFALGVAVGRFWGALGHLLRRLSHRRPQVVWTRPSPWDAEAPRRRTF